MKEKIKVLITRKKKWITKRAKQSSNIEYIIEKMAPGVYEFIDGVGEENIIMQVEKCSPEIIFIVPYAQMDGLNLLRQIKRLQPTANVFVFLLNIIDNEEETIDQYMSLGAYKCFLPPLNINTLVHDMYVSLNLE